MLLLNYDFYDIYAVLLSFRNDPSNAFNEKIAKTIKALLESPQVDNIIESNIIRRSIAEIENLDIELLAWIKTNNVYTYGQKVIKEKIAYHILFEGFSELLLCLQDENYKRFEALADALHNVPIILSEKPKNFSKLIKTEISTYRKMWNNAFLKEIIR